MLIRRSAGFRRDGHIGSPVFKPSGGSVQSNPSTPGLVPDSPVRSALTRFSRRRDREEPTSITRSGRVGRLLDRHVGTALLHLLGLTRPRVPFPMKPERVAISVLGAIGDALIASALSQDIRRALPGAHITLVASSTNQAIAALLPAIDAVLIVPAYRPDVAIRMIRASKFDVLVDCNQWLRISAIHAALAGCFTIGFRTAGQGRHHAYDRAVDHLATRHELENYRALLTPLGIAPQAHPTVAIAPEAHAAVAPLLQGDGLGTIVFHPWAGGANAAMKEWPTKHWIALGAALQERGYGICVTGAKADVAKTDNLIAAAAKHRVTMHLVAGRLSLPQVGALLTGAAAVVSVNTGIMHLAAAVDARLVALHGPTNPSRWGPLSARAMSLVPEGVPSGYLHLGYEFPKNAIDCMAAISVETVLGAVLDVVEQDNGQLSVPASAAAA